jgi:hypothetical protein
MINLVLNCAQVTYASGAQAVRGMAMPIGSSSSAPLATAVIELDPGEYFTSISGTTFNYSAQPQLVRGVASLTLSTNKRVYGPYGVASTDKPFEVRGPVYGFHGAVIRGSTTDLLAAIGFWRGPAGKQRTRMAFEPFFGECQDVTFMRVCN